MDNTFPKLLIISNECLSNVSSNGRTLRNFLIGWPKDKIAQFFLRGTTPDFDVCDKYYRVSDADALNAFIKGKRKIGIVNAEESQNTTASNGTDKKKDRNALTMMIRNTVWNSMRWAGKNFYNWADEFLPELILLQAGDCAFMLKLARKLAKRYSARLVIYNSEAYYFKKFDYFKSSGIAKLLYPIFYRNFCKEFDKTIKLASTSIYICDKLKNDYDEHFALPSEVVYTATQMTAGKKSESTDTLRVSYLGNLGVGRHEGLVDIANALHRISPEYKLDVYGKIPNDEVKNAFDNCRGIRHMGFVSYDEVISVMQQSDILVHTENFSDFYREDLKYAFSTKLADSIASGTCFLLYAPCEMACAEYLTKNELAFVVSEKDELEDTLRELCESAELRNKYITNAIEFAKENHDADKNSARFQEILRNAVK